MWETSSRFSAVAAHLSGFGSILSVTDGDKTFRMLTVILHVLFVDQATPEIILAAGGQRDDRRVVHRVGDDVRGREGR